MELVAIPHWRKSSDSSFDFSRLCANCSGHAMSCHHAVLLKRKLSKQSCHCCLPCRVVQQAGHDASLHANACSPTVLFNRKCNHAITALPCSCYKAVSTAPSPPALPVCVLAGHDASRRTQAMVMFSRCVHDVMFSSVCISKQSSEMTHESGDDHLLPCQFARLLVMMHASASTAVMFSQSLLWSCVGPFESGRVFKPSPPALPVCALAGHDARLCKYSGHVLTVSLMVLCWTIETGRVFKPSSPALPVCTLVGHDAAHTVAPVQHLVLLQHPPGGRRLGHFPLGARGGSTSSTATTASTVSTATSTALTLLTAWEGCLGSTVVGSTVAGSTVAGSNHSTTAPRYEGGSDTTVVPASAADAVGARMDVEGCGRCGCRCGGVQHPAVGAYKVALQQLVGGPLQDL